MQERVHSLIFENDDVTWQSILSDLVREEGMDPWNIDIGVLAEKYRSVLKDLKRFDVRISAKVILAAAILLRMKSTHLLEKDIHALEQLIESTVEDVDDFYAELEDDYYEGDGAIIDQPPELVPRTPQPRKRRVALDDLMDALRKALEVRRRRVLRSIEPDPEAVNTLKRRRDITEIIAEIHLQITNFFKDQTGPLMFTDLIPSEEKSDMIMTFIPLLHLATPPHEKVDLHQEQHFGGIEIKATEKA